MDGPAVTFLYRIENPWRYVANDDKIGKLVIGGQQVSAKQIYESIEKEVGRIRVVYEIRPLQETRPLKKNGPEVFKAGEEIELRIQIQWPRGIRAYCEDHFTEIKLGSATNDRCDCGRYNIQNEEEVMCRVCALMKRVCSVCQKPVDLEEEEEAVKDECDTYDVDISDVSFPLDFSWLHRNDDGFRVGLKK